MKYFLLFSLLAIAKFSLAQEINWLDESVKNNHDDFVILEDNAGNPVFFFVNYYTFGTFKSNTKRENDIYRIKDGKLEHFPYSYQKETGAFHNTSFSKIFKLKNNFVILSLADHNNSLDYRVSIIDGNSMAPIVIEKKITTKNITKLKMLTRIWHGDFGIKVHKFNESFVLYIDQSLPNGNETVSVFNISETGEIKSENKVDFGFDDSKNLITDIVALSENEHLFCIKSLYDDRTEMVNHFREGEKGKKTSNTKVSLIKVSGNTIQSNTELLMNDKFYNRSYFVQQNGKTKLVCLYSDELKKGLLGVTTTDEGQPLGDILSGLLVYDCNDLKPTLQGKNYDLPSTLISLASKKDVGGSDGISAFMDAEFALPAENGDIYLPLYYTENVSTTGSSRVATSDLKIKDNILLHISDNGLQYSYYGNNQTYAKQDARANEILGFKTLVKGNSAYTFYNEDYGFKEKDISKAEGKFGALFSTKSEFVVAEYKNNTASKKLLHQSTKKINIVLAQNVYLSSKGIFYCIGENEGEFSFGSWKP